MRELKSKEEQYNTFLKYKESKRKQRKNFGKTLLTVTIISTIILVGAVFAFAYKTDPEFANTVNSSISPILEKLNMGSSNNDFSIPFINKKQNILVVGVDSNGSNSDPFSGTRSDTMILLNIDPRNRSVNAISIPRDSKVYVSGGHGVQKINAAHALGGIELTKKTVEETLGIKIDNYLLINNEGVRKLVDSIGGVPIYIEKDMYYNDNSGGLHINLSKGIHVLKGRDVEGYLRYRKDGLGDIGRTSRQQWFIKALMEKLQTPEAITKIPDAIKIANTYIKTDMNLYQLSQYAALTRGINLDSVEVATLPGTPNKKGYISYWILDPEKTQEVIDRMVYRRKPNYQDAKLIAGIMYSFDKEAEAMKIKEQLQQNGYEVNCIGRAHLPHSQLIGHDAAVTSDFIDWLKKKVPEVRHSQFVYDPIRTYCVKSDFTIIIAGS